MIDNTLFIDEFAEPVTITHAGIDYPVQAIFDSSPAGNDKMHGVPFKAGHYQIDLLTSEAKRIGIVINDAVTINDVKYTVVETPFDDHGMTTVKIRK